MFRLVRSLLLVLASTSFAFGLEETLTPVQIRTAMQSERSKIFSGRFVANGNINKVEGQEVENFGSLRWKFEFDLTNGSFLLDRNEPCRPDPELRKSTSDRVRTFFCEDKSAQYTYHDIIIPIASVHVHDKDSLAEKIGSQFQRLDVRGLGFYNFENAAAQSERGDRLFFEHQMVKEPSAEIRVEPETDAIVKIWFEKSFSSIVLKTCLWVDKSKGFTPIRCVSYANERVEMESQTEWESVNGVWVPKRLTGKSRIPFIPAGKERTEENMDFKKEDFELEIDWEAVNQTQGSESYDFRSFDMPKGTRVFKGSQLVHIYGHKMPDPNYGKAKPQGFSNLLLSLYISVVMLIVLSLFVRKFRTKR